MVARAKSKGRQEAPITWRDGLHLTGTSIWCDAKRARDICFVSVASAIRRARHGQLVGSPETLKMLERPGQEASSQLAVPYGQPFTVGRNRIELFRSGHALGAASLLVNIEGKKVVYAGAINPHGSALGGELDYRAADVLVVSARYGQKHFSFPDAQLVAGQLRERCQQVCQTGGVAVLLLADTGKALDVAELLAGAGLPLQAHHSINKVSSSLRSKGITLPALKSWSRKSKTGRVLLWPLRARAKLSLDELPRGSSMLLVSGLAGDATHVKASDACEGFVLSNQADHRGLLAYIKSSGASEVYLIHSGDRGAALAGDLPGVRVTAIGPPEQLSLF